jgi:membrane protease subunit (stomatin/prohibitin family)
VGLFDALRSELVDIIEWLDDDRHTLVWRFPRPDNEIKQGAELIVRPGQVAIFVSQGRLADVFPPGRYQLQTGNLPILSTLKGWKHGFDSPFRSEVYFVSTRQVTGLKWGTPRPVMLRDPEFGPIRLRAFGTYTLKATQPRTLLEELVGTDQQFDSNEVSELLRSMINNSFADMLGESNVAALDLASNYDEFADELRTRVVEQIDDEYGLDIPRMMIANISFPEAVEKALDTRTSMGVIGDMNKFQQYQMGNAVMAAAENPAGGSAGEGLGIGLGVAMGTQMAPGMGRPMQQQAPPQPAFQQQAPPPPPPAPMWHVAVNGATQGPFSMAQMQQGAASGEIQPATMVWTQGMPSWSPASQVPQLQGLFPPPMPPAPTESSS